MAERLRCGAGAVLDDLLHCVGDVCSDVLIEHRLGVHTVAVEHLTVAVLDLLDHIEAGPVAAVGDGAVGCTRGRSPLGSLLAGCQPLADGGGRSLRPAGVTTPPERTALEKVENPRSNGGSHASLSGIPTETTRQC